jgi:two-component system LytT family response regulator
MPNMPKKLRAILVEDEATSRETLRNYLASYCPNVDLLKECAEIKTGEEAIRELKPDLVFLDVEMPFGTGFDLLEKFNPIDFEVVFVTAYAQYAIKALNLSASYYIMKPIDIDELVTAVDKVYQNQGQESEANKTLLLQNMRQAKAEEHRISLPMLDGFELVKVGEILRCKAVDNYTEFFLNNGEKKLICKTLKYYDEILKPYGFFRTHKSHLVNLAEVRGYKKGSGGYAVMTDQSEVEIASRRKASFLAALHRV